MAQRGEPTRIRSDNGSEFVARPLQTWLAQRQVQTFYITPGSPWQNGHVESFHGSLRDECLDRELLLSLAEVRILIEDYRRHYHEVQPHGGLGYRTPAEACRQAQIQAADLTSALCWKFEPTIKTDTRTIQPNLPFALDQTCGLDHRIG
ncbi:MAG: transposase [Rhodospirillales bacterium]|nr:transposase [Acetobacter sp.]